ncbi:hypothetical protein BC831DRAFT_451853 [Entophlyctis helioformis]|nr:hypothetical protein BC831DRAFT_451853 [Entophlyctis helioformis]
MDGRTDGCCLGCLGMRWTHGMQRHTAACNCSSDTNRDADRIGGGMGIKRPDPDQLKLSGPQLWTELHVKSPPVGPQVDEENDLLQHPLYTPPLNPDTSIGPLIKPLHYPEFDQRKNYWTDTGVRGYDSINDYRFEDPKQALIGQYPDVTPQFATLRDPYAYWDQQGRRNFGEILYDHDNLTHIWGIGHTVHWWVPVVTSARVFGFLAFLATLVYVWDTEKHLFFAEKDYPYNGLRIELGGDPNDESDNYGAAPVYKI